MSVSLSPYAGAGAQFFDNNGNPLAGGKIFTYAAGTTTPLATYTDYTGSTANPVYPTGIVLDSAGRTPAQIWLTEGSSYKFVLETALGVTIKTDDNIFASYELAKAIGVSVGLGASGVPTNIAVGDTALDSNTTGSNNTAVGYNALTANTDGFQNTALGSEALDANTSGDYNTAVGYQALTAASTANYNTGIGYRTLQAVTTGANNVAVGAESMLVMGTGSDNVAMGFRALDAYFGSNAVAIGSGALGAATSGSQNTAVGKSALAGLTTGGSNVAVGFEAIPAGNGVNNVAIGAASLFGGTNASDNVAIGTSAGSSITTGSNNILIGYAVAASSATVSNEITLGNASITSMRVPGLTLTFSAKYFNNGTLTVGTLPAAATAGAGARAVVTDANATTFHSIVAAGAPNNTVPVFSDGTNWRIG